MNFQKLIIPYSNDNDIDQILNIFKSSNPSYFFSKNKLSFTSIFCSEKINTNAEFQLISYKESFNKYLKSLVKETLNDIRDFYKINIAKNEELILEMITSHFKTNIKRNGLLNTIYSLFFLIISSYKKNQDNQKDIITLSIVLVNNLLIFFGFYLQWDYLFENSYVGFWSQIFTLVYEENNNKIIENKLLNHFLNHTRVYFMEPIFFDNNEDNLNINENNIFINIIFSKNEINIDQMNNLYINKLKKIDRTLLSICNNIQ